MSDNNNEPIPQPDDDAEDEEGGRFFGGGISSREKEILDYMDEDGEEAQGMEVIDEAWLRKTALSFEKKISKNAEMRVKFEDEPYK